MRKLLLSTAAFAGFAFVANAAQAADGVSLDLGGYASGYVVYTDQDEAPGADLRKFDFRKDTEVHLTGETTLDNGLTVGAHMELLADRADNDSIVEESYVYLSGGWGRVNFGEEDGVAYLLQVAAPSADDKVDGLRPNIGTFNLLGASATIDYAHDDTGYSNKITYLTPIFNGFQAGVSFTPTVESDNTRFLGIISSPLPQQGPLNGLSSVTTANDGDQFENAWEGAVRYEGTFEGVDVALGGGYSLTSLESEALSVLYDDDLQTWNIGANVGVAGWGFGAAYVSSNNGIEDDGDLDTWVLGADYTTGPYKLGVSYLNYDQELGAGASLEADRYTAGVTYEYGPGMSFRGAVQYIDAESGAFDGDGTQVTLGTQVNF